MKQLPQVQQSAADQIPSPSVPSGDGGRPLRATVPDVSQSVRSKAAAIVEARRRWGRAARIEVAVAWWLKGGGRYFAPYMQREFMFPEDSLIERAPEYRVGAVMAFLPAFEIKGSGRSWDEAFAQADKRSGLR